MRALNFPATALLGAVLTAVLPGTPAEAARPVERHNWVVGVAYGVGHADVTFKNPENNLDWSRGASPQLRAAKMIGSHFSIGIEDRQWLDEAGVQGDKIRGNIQNVNLVLTVYPGSTKNLTSGFILQAGIGIAQARLSLLEPFEGGKNEWGETHEVIAKTDEGGSGWLVGAGYEIRVSSHFAAGATVTFNSLTFDDQIFDTVEFIPGGLHLNWYF